MSPLPCSPVSNSTASEPPSHPNTSSEPSSCSSAAELSGPDDNDVEHDDDDDDDDEDRASLVTPRPGPADPAQRTESNLSRPSVPHFLSTSPASPRTFLHRSRSSPSASAAAVAAAREGVRDGGRRDPSHPAVGPTTHAAADGEGGAAVVEAESAGLRTRARAESPRVVQQQQPSRSIAFAPGSASSPRGSGSGSGMRSGGSFGGGSGRNSGSGTGGEVEESSADERTAFVRGARGSGYGAMWTRNRGREREEETGYEDDGEEGPLGGSVRREVEDGREDESPDVARPGEAVVSGAVRRRKSTKGRSKNSSSTLR